MVLSTGFYRTQSGSFHLVQDKDEPGFVVLTTGTQSDHPKFRRDKAFWLSVDDGLIGKHGTPDHLRVRIDGSVYRIWVEQRGRDQVSPYLVSSALCDLSAKFGLIPTDESGTYSNKFIGITRDGELTVVDEWSSDNESVWVVSTTWEGEPGV